MTPSSRAGSPSLSLEAVTKSEVSDIAAARKKNESWRQKWSGRSVSNARMSEAYTPDVRVKVKQPVRVEERTEDSELVKATRKSNTYTRSITESGEGCVDGLCLRRRNQLLSAPVSIKAGHT